MSLYNCTENMFFIDIIIIRPKLWFFVLLCSEMISFYCLISFCLPLLLVNEVDQNKFFCTTGSYDCFFPCVELFWEFCDAKLIIPELANLLQNYDSAFSFH